VSDFLCCTVLLSLSVFGQMRLEIFYWSIALEEYVGALMESALGRTYYRLDCDVKENSSQWSNICHGEAVRVTSVMVLNVEERPLSCMVAGCLWMPH